MHLVTFREDDVLPFFTYILTLFASSFYLLLNSGCPPYVLYTFFGNFLVMFVVKNVKKCTKIEWTDACILFSARKVYTECLRFDVKYS